MARRNNQMKKLILSLGLVASMMTPVMASATTYQDGDENCDGNVTAGDAARVLNIAKALNTQTPGCTARIDMNCTGVITAADAAIVYHHALGRTVAGYVENCA